MEKKYYIEDTATAEVLLTDGSYGYYDNINTPQGYDTLADAEAKIDTLDAGDYKVFVMYHKS